MGSTVFWQIAGVLLNVVQMGLYLTAVDKYKTKLEEFATFLCASADTDRANYGRYRGADPTFYSYYDSLPSYDECDSNIKRAKGAAFNAYGQSLRRSLQTNRGYTSLNKVHLNNMIAGNQQVMSRMALQMATTHIAERTIVDEHRLRRAAAVASAPTGIEGFSPSSTSLIIKQSFTSLRSFAQGFNSAGAAFGKQLFQVLN